MLIIFSCLGFHAFLRFPEVASARAQGNFCSPVRPQISSFLLDIAKVRIFPDANRILPSSSEFFRILPSYCLENSIFFSNFARKQNDMDKKIRAFGRSELAQQYFPNLKPMTAWEKFKEWLDINPRLRPLLTFSRRTYTPAEVQLIYSELGEP